MINTMRKCRECIAFNHEDVFCIPMCMAAEGTPVEPEQTACKLFKLNTNNEDYEV